MKRLIENLLDYRNRLDEAVDREAVVLVKEFGPLARVTARQLHRAVLAKGGAQAKALGPFYTKVKKRISEIEGQPRTGAAYDDEDKWIEPTRCIEGERTQRPRS